jgi:hypothetical protein
MSIPISIARKRGGLIHVSPPFVYSAFRLYRMIERMQALVEVIRLVLIQNERRDHQLQSLKKPLTV